MSHSATFAMHAIIAVDKQHCIEIKFNTILRHIGVAVKFNYTHLWMQCFAAKTTIALMHRLYVKNSTRLNHDTSQLL